MSDTAKLVGKDHSTVSKDIQLAEAITNFPELKLGECKNKAEAFKRLRSVGKLVSTTIAAEAYQKSMQDSQIFTNLSKAYMLKDCFEAFKNIPDSVMNFVEIDPPYGIDLHSVKKDNACTGYNEVAAKDYVDFMRRVLTEAYRIMKEESWIVVWFAADPWFSTIADLMEDVGFKMNRLPGEWIKPQGQTAQPETYLGNSYEMFFYAHKGKARLNKPGRSNVYQFSPVPPAQKYHPTQRPLDLMVEIFKTFTRPGASCFIPFLGSGVSLIAAHLNQMNAVGTDLTKEFKDGYIMQLKEILGHE
jgi:site-specific DNA-methyltransferase (adenine-specific)